MHSLANANLLTQKRVGSKPEFHFRTVIVNSLNIRRGTALTGNFAHTIFVDSGLVS
jgi:hypothetical protein